MLVRFVTPFALRYRRVRDPGRGLRYLSPNGELPFALSLSKCCGSALGFDKLSPNGGERRSVC